MPDRDDLVTFEQTSPVLLGLAYRMLGSRADAEDAVQDTFLRWQDADKHKIENPSGWLTATCTRRCIDLLRSAHRARVDYVGAWLLGAYSYAGRSERRNRTVSGVVPVDGVSADARAPDPERAGRLSAS